MTNLKTPISELPRVGLTLTRALHRLEIKTVADLLLHFPYKYLDFSVFSFIKDIKSGQIVTIRATIKAIDSRFSFKGRMSLCEAVVSDSTGSVKVVWFNQPYLKNTLHAGDEIMLSGKADFYKTLQLQNPIYERISEDGETTHTGRIVPVYHSTENLYNRTLRNLIKQCLHLSKDLPDLVPAAIQKKYNLLSLEKTVAQIHFPYSQALLAKAQQRIAFDEVFIQQLAVKQHKQRLAQLPAPVVPVNIPLVKKFLTTLPFELTLGQKSALWQIMQDMEIKHPMNRLLQGDVGSGKTLVALISMLEAAQEGFQTVLLAPTELLAKQHFDTINTFLKEFGSKKSLAPALLTSQLHRYKDETITKAELIKNIKKGSIKIIVGTHAVLHKGVVFKNLGLAIIDEQHRFGVGQRSELLHKVFPAPHLLSMSATPIPRTLALSLYGDLEVSTLHELPKGRQKVTTTIIAEDSRNKAYDFVKKQVAAGRQAFVIAPRVEETGESDIKSVKAEFERLSKEIFPKLKLGLLYGSMKAADKEHTMGKFNSGDIDVLVATSLIEIGIDVPNATAMIIENADRFGLAQLHQLRGRVGRGRHASSCFLFTDSEDENTLRRLHTFATNHDGFALAELDLQQRGFGSLFGTEQTGFDFKFARYLTSTLLENAKEGASSLIKQDVNLKAYPLLKEKVEPLSSAVHLE